jgi:tRNA A-37 threonylcarbamoyl transferase component Bud32
MTEHPSLRSTPPSFRTLHNNGTTWTIREDVIASLPENLLHVLHHPEQHPELMRIRENNVRASFLMKLSDQSGWQVFIKRYKMRGLRDVVKYLVFSSKARTEWRSLRAFEAHNLSVPHPLALAEQKTGWILKDSCIVIAALTQALPLNEYVEKQILILPPEQQLPVKQSLFLSLARLVSDVHYNKIFYRDLHAGNILVESAGYGNYRPYLIDLHRALFLPKLMQWMRVRDLAQLCNSVPATKTDKMRFLKEYCRNGSLPIQSLNDLARKIAATAQRMETVRVKSRSKRCIKNSTMFEVQKTSQYHYYGRRDFGREAALRVIDMHVHTVNTDTSRILKTTKNSMLTAHQHAEVLPGAVCVKAYPSRGIIYWLKSLVVKSRALQSWIAGNSLLVRGIDTPQPLALVERIAGPFVKESFLITEWLENAIELNDYVSLLHHRSVSSEVKDLFVESLAHVIRNLHDQHVYHADLKSTNILVLERGGTEWKFYFVDLDRVLFKKKLTFYERANNLAQINASVSSLMMLKDRLKFFNFYAKGTPLIKEREKYYREILKISRTKHTEPFGVIFR